MFKRDWIYINKQYTDFFEGQSFTNGYVKYRYSPSKNKAEKYDGELWIKLPEGAVEVLKKEYIDKGVYAIPPTSTKVKSGIKP